MAPSIPVRPLHGDVLGGMVATLVFYIPKKLRDEIHEQPHTGSAPLVSTIEEIHRR